MSCRICRSPYRREIEFLLSQKVGYAQIARKYHAQFDKTERSFYDTLVRHDKKKHPPMIDPTPVTSPVEGSTFNDYAKSLLRVGFDPTMMTPKRVSHNNIISAQRTLLEERKVNGALDAQKLAFLKFFRGSVIEGEVIDGNESDGVKDLPSNTK